MAMIEEETFIIKPRRLISIMNLLTDGPMAISSFVPHKETIEAIERLVIPVLISI